MRPPGSQRRSLPIALALASAALVAGAPAAGAQSYEVTLEVVPKADPKKDEPGQIAAKVVSPTAPPPVDKIKLIQTDNKAGPIEIAASDLKRYVEGDETLGLAVVFETQHLWLGNNTWWEGHENSKTDGYYKPLTGAVDKLAAAGPAGSKAVLIAYGNGSRELWKGDLKDLGADKFPSQRDLTARMGDDGKLTQVIGQDVSAGVEDAITELKKMGVARMALVLIGDGLNADSLKEFKKRLQNDNIAAYAIYLSAPALEGDPNGWKNLTSNVRSLDSADNLPAALGWVVDSLADRFYVRFPGWDPKLQRSFDWDGKPHAFTLKIDKAEIEADELALAPAWKPPWMRAKKGSKWWLFIVIPVGLILLIVIGVKVFGGKKEAPEPVAVPVPAPGPAAPAPAPAPAGPMKTVMIGIGGDDQGFPVVGWIVPLNGPNQFQTFKLQAGATKIGTGGPAHIVINDGFMSTEHCQIVASPAGFTLVDGGSTNGTYVNDRKVDKHELVDNDVILMGKTSFRFKSIN